ncbi:MAG: Fur family transcriptional regulator [bacterium]
MSMSVFNATQFLKSHDLRPTKPRKAIAALLFADGKDRHATADWVIDELARMNAPISTASVYNTLHTFTESGILRQVHGAEHGVIIFDTNISDHFHLYNERTGDLTDIPAGAIRIEHEAALPDGADLVGCDVVLRIR